MSNYNLINLIRELDLINAIIMSISNLSQREYLLKLRLKVVLEIFDIDPDYNASKGEAILRAYGND
jgi:hypothetical protein